MVDYIEVVVPSGPRECMELLPDVGITIPHPSDVRNGGDMEYSFSGDRTLGTRWWGEDGIVNPTNVETLRDPVSKVSIGCPDIEYGNNVGGWNDGSPTPLSLLGFLLTPEGRVTSREYLFVGLTKGTSKDGDYE